MNTTLHTTEPAFPLSTPATQRPTLRAPRLPAHAPEGVAFALGHSACLRAWSGRRARLTLSPLMRMR